MTTRARPAQSETDKPAPLPVGQHEGEGTNAVTSHKPDPSADPVADGEHRYVPATGYNHGND